MLENASRYWIGVGAYAGNSMLGVTQVYIQIFKVKYYIYFSSHAGHIHHSDGPEQNNFNSTFWSGIIACL